MWPRRSKLPPSGEWGQTEDSISNILNILNKPAPAFKKLKTQKVQP